MKPAVIFRLYSLHTAEDGDISLVSDICKFGTANDLEALRDLVHGIISRRSFTRFRLVIDGYLMIYIEREVPYKLVGLGESKQLYLLAGYHHLKITIDILDQYPIQPVVIKKSPRKSFFQAFFELHSSGQSQSSELLLIDDHLVAEVLPFDFCHQECQSQITALQEAFESYQVLSEAKLEVLQRLLDTERTKKQFDATASDWFTCKSFSSCIISLLDCKNSFVDALPKKRQPLSFQSSKSGEPSTEIIPLQASPLLSHENASQYIPTILRRYTVKEI